MQQHANQYKRNAWGKVLFLDLIKPSHHKFTFVLVLVCFISFFFIGIWFLLSGALVFTFMIEVKLLAILLWFQIC